MGILPFKDPGIDFTEVQPCQGHRYLWCLLHTYLGWAEADLNHLHREGMRSRKSPLEVGNRQVWTSPFHPLRQQTEFHSRHSSRPTQNLKNRMEAPLGLQTPELRESRVYEPDPENNFSRTLPGNSVPLYCWPCSGHTIPQGPWVTHLLRFSRTGHPL